MFEIEKKYKNLTQESVANTFSFSDYNHILSHQPSVLCNLLQVLYDSIKTISEMQQCKTQFLNKQHHVHLTQATTDEKSVSDMIRSVIGEIVIKENIVEKKQDTREQMSQLQIKLPQVPKEIKANFFRQLKDSNLANIFVDNKDGFSLFDRKTLRIYEFDASCSLIKQNQFRAKEEELGSIESIHLQAYYVSDIYICISNSQRNRKIYVQHCSSCVKEVSPLINADQWALCPIECKEIVAQRNEQYMSLGLLSSNSSYEIKFAHAYIFRNETKGTICLKFCANEKNKLSTIKQYQLTSTSESARMLTLGQIAKQIIPFKDLLLTTNKSISLFAVAYSIHIFVLDATGNLVYQFDSIKKPETMCFNQVDQIILANLVQQNGYCKFEVTISSGSAAQAFLKYDHKNLVQDSGSLISIAVNNSDIIFFATDKGYIWALGMK